MVLVLLVGSAYYRICEGVYAWFLFSVFLDYGFGGIADVVYVTLCLSFVVSEFANVDTAFVIYCASLCAQCVFVILLVGLRLTLLIHLFIILEMCHRDPYNVTSLYLIKVTSVREIPECCFRELDVMEEGDCMDVSAAVLAYHVPDLLANLLQMDKASVLGDAIKYVKTLEEKLKTLEEKLPKKRMRSLSSKKQASPAACSPGSQGSKPAAKQQLVDEVVDEDDGSQPEIEARKIDKNLLIRMHCEKRKSLLVKSLAELEKMKLVILNANILSFSANTVDFTCCAQVLHFHRMLCVVLEFFSVNARFQHKPLQSPYPDLFMIIGISL